MSAGRSLRNTVIGIADLLLKLEQLLFERGQVARIGWIRNDIVRLMRV